MRMRLCIVYGLRNINEGVGMHFQLKPVVKKSVKTGLKASAILSLLIMVTACQPKADAPSDKKSENVTSSQQQKNLSPYIESKSIVLTPKQSQSCDEAGCTRYDFQTVQTNHAWINQYFLDRIQKIEPLAFENVKNATNKKNATAETVDEKQLSESSIVVRYVGQNQNLATFELLTYSYSAGAAHGMYHKEYVNFDLKNKKRIALQDLIASGSEAKLIEALYQNNMTWLDAHSVEQAKLQLSDNFYYGANGIVFVYPLYELASYAEGMSELNLPYVLVKDLIKPEYLPNLPQYAER